MKYSNQNPLLQCMQTHSTCYQGTRQMQVLGVLWHSTGANNPNICRYVQPYETDPNYNEMVKIIGKNSNKNDWNHIYKSAGLNAWIGKLANGEVSTVQTMPWNYRPWGCGSGSKGSCNNGWIQFEICEDSLNSKDYCEKVYKEACELTAYLCKLYNIDPNGYVSMNGVQVPTILCHHDSYKLGMGSGHVDIDHWFPKYGLSMDTARQDICKLMNIEYKPNSTPTPTNNTTGGTFTVNYPVLSKAKNSGKYNEQVKQMQLGLIALGYNLGADGADGYFGNMSDTAVRNFQKKNGLTVDGVYGEASFKKMHGL